VCTVVKALLAAVALIASACSSSVPLSADASPTGDPASSAGALDRVSKAKASTSCFDIDDLYSQAVFAAKRCDPNGADQCLVTARLSLACGCYGMVTDATEINEIAEVWAMRGCPGKATFQCPDGCVVSNGTMPCVRDTAGDGVCADLAPNGP
jgi:hypothetical protein